MGRRRDWPGKQIVNDMVRGEADLDGTNERALPEHSADTFPFRV